MSSARTKLTIAALSAITIVAVDAGAAHASPGLAVSLTVDGRTEQVTTTAATVAGLLTEQSVTVDPPDAVDPAPDTSLRDGESVAVRHTTPVRVRRSGTVRAAYVTSRTYADAVVELGLYPHTYPAKAASFSGHRDRSFLTVDFRTPSGVAAAGTDLLQPHSVLHVAHVRIDYRASRHVTQPTTRRSRTPLVPAGHTSLVRRGRKGVGTILRRTKYVDGSAVERRVVGRHRVHAARARVIRVGTGPNWYGLAKCESGGNPNAFNAAGYYGLYQFSVSTWHAVGGKGVPTNWGRREQTYRAWLLFKRRGAAPWPVCGAHL